MHNNLLNLNNGLGRKRQLLHLIFICKGYGTFGCNRNSGSELKEDVYMCHPYRRNSSTQKHLHPLVIVEANILII
jgi:hypothetical protein